MPELDLDPKNEPQVWIQFQGKERGHSCMWGTYLLMIKSQLEDQIQRVHLQEGPFTCFLCSKTSTSRERIRVYSRFTHSTEWPFTAPLALIHLRIELV